MYTLKIRWARFERTDDGIVGEADESTLFIPAERVSVHGFIEAGTREQAMSKWPGGSYFNYLTVVTGGEDGGRLIRVDLPGGGEEWYLVSLAWLLGPDGGTIERVAP